MAFGMMPGKASTREYSARTELAALRAELAASGLAKTDEGIWVDKASDNAVESNLASRRATAEFLAKYVRDRPAPLFPNKIYRDENYLDWSTDAALSKLWQEGLMGRAVGLPSDFSTIADIDVTAKPSTADPRLEIDSRSDEKLQSDQDKKQIQKLMLERAKKLRAQMKDLLKET